MRPRSGSGEGRRPGPGGSARRRGRRCLGRACGHLDYDVGAGACGRVGRELSLAQEMAGGTAVVRRRTQLGGPEPAFGLEGCGGMRVERRAADDRRRVEGDRGGQQQSDRSFGHRTGGRISDFEASNQISRRERARQRRTRGGPPTQSPAPEGRSGRSESASLQRWPPEQNGVGPKPPRPPMGWVRRGRSRSEGPWTGRRSRLRCSGLTGSSLTLHPPFSPGSMPSRRRSSADASPATVPAGCWYQPGST